LRLRVGPATIAAERRKMVKSKKNFNPSLVVSSNQNANSFSYEKENSHHKLTIRPGHRYGPSTHYSHAANASKGFNNSVFSSTNISLSSMKSQVSDRHTARSLDGESNLFYSHRKNQNAQLTEREVKDLIGTQYDSSLIDLVKAIDFYDDYSNDM
jgi:hypothetical protein